MELALAHARAAGPVPPGHYRVVVIEPDGRIHHRDLASLASARTYVADVRHEVEDDRGSPLAYLLDDQLVPVQPG